MKDPLRADRPSTGDTPDRERDARIEELLLTGLDHYFAGEHELAINVWTRVLFLDRTHPTARAYIERARSAVSEQQREGDELFHAGAAALRRGDRAAARQLLTSAVERGAGGEDALALLHRLDRLDPGGGRFVTAARVASPAVETGPDRTPPGRRDSRLAWVVGGITAGALIAAVAGGYLWIVSEPLEVGAAGAALPAAAEEPLPVPAPCELRLLRARDLFARGRLHEALAALEPGDPDERHRAAYDGLRATIQRQLLEAGRTAGSLPPGQTQPR